jgi:nucleotide-binding universal stress UspA family protein
MFKNILVPTDGSRLSQRGVKGAVALAKELKARVFGFYVAPDWDPGVYGEIVSSRYVSPQQYRENAKKTARRVLAAVERAAAAAGVRCECGYALGGYPYQEILKAARKHRCDLIVMASHGRRGISRLLLGSETSKVLAHTSIPVLVIR